MTGPSPRPTREQVEGDLVAAEAGLWNGRSVEGVLARLAAEVRAQREELDRVHSALRHEADARAAERGRLRATLGAVHQVLRQGKAAEFPGSQLHDRLVAALDRPQPAAGDRVVEGGIAGTLERCSECSGDGLLHRPDPAELDRFRVEPTPAEQVGAIDCSATPCRMQVPAYAHRAGDEIECVCSRRLVAVDVPTRGRVWQRAGSAAAPQPAVPDGEDVPALLDAAADALTAQGLWSSASEVRDVADAMRDWGASARAAVAAALARPPQGCTPKDGSR